MWGKAHRVGLTTGGLEVFEAHLELRDVAEHVISAGELFTRLADPNDVTPAQPQGSPVCSWCRPFQVEGGAA